MRLTRLQRFAFGASCLLHRSLANAPTFGPKHALAYNSESFGKYPQVTFESSDRVSPRILRSKWDAICDATPEYYYFLAPYGHLIEHEGPLILDHNGQMVWRGEGSPRAYGLMVQEYDGEPYLTWWAGDDHISGHGVGNYFMLDSEYAVQEILGNLHNIPSDLHEFHITDKNTVITTSFVRTPFNLSQIGLPGDGYIWDGAFEEIDIATQTVLFEWSASTHLSLHDCIPMATRDDIGTREWPYDYYHINSVDKDPQGNYLVSARYCGVKYVDGRTGNILWNLGGLNNQFTDLSGGNATDFIYQHHVRWTDEYTAISLFDNHATTTRGKEKPSRGLKIHVDLEKMTATLLIEFLHPTHLHSYSQGSVQSLDNGNYLIGYGHTPAFTEFYPNGSIACDAQFTPLEHVDGKLITGGGQSYRIFKQRWKGIPNHDPSIAIVRVENTEGEESSEKVLYVSWNGATEVRKWLLEGSSDRRTWSTIGSVVKDGFENTMPVNMDLWLLLRLTALDGNEKIIRRWLCFDSGTMIRIYEEQTEPSDLVDENAEHDAAILDESTPDNSNIFAQHRANIIFELCAAAAVGAAVGAAFMWWLKRRGRYSPLIGSDPGQSLLSVVETAPLLEPSTLSESTSLLSKPIEQGFNEMKVR